MITRNDILEYIRQQLNYLKRHHHVQKIGIFGSFARNEYHETSDLDLLVEFDEETQNLFETKNEIRKMFQKEFGLSVDIAREKYLKPYIKEQILSETIYVDSTMTDLNRKI